MDCQLAAYGWVSLNLEDIGELNLRIKLLPGEVNIWDCAILPDYHGKRLYSALLAYIPGELFVQGLCRAWIGADLDDIPSQKGMARAGFHHVADLGIERALEMRQVWVTGFPGIPESIVAEARLAFLNDREQTCQNSVTSTTIDSS